MPRRMYMLAFVAVLLVACVGAFAGGRYLWLRLQGDVGAQRSWTPPTAAVAVAPATAQPAAAASRPPTVRPTATRPIIPSPMPFQEPTYPPAASTPASNATPAPGETARPGAELTGTPPGSATPAGTATAAPTVQDTAFAFSLARPVRDSSGDCPGEYVLGQVTDRSGSPLPGISLRLVDEYGNQEVKVTKAGGADAGHYDFPLFGPARHLYLTVVGGSGQALSQPAEILYRLGAGEQASCHWVDWIRR